MFDSDVADHGDRQLAVREAPGPSARATGRPIAEHRTQVAAVEADIAAAMSRAPGPPGRRPGPGRAADHRAGPRAPAVGAAPHRPRLTSWSGSAPPTCPPRSTVEDPPGRHRRDRPAAAPDVPVAVLAARAGVVGIAGRGDWPRAWPAGWSPSSPRLHSPPTCSSTAHRRRRRSAGVGRLAAARRAARASRRSPPIGTDAETIGPPGRRAARLDRRPPAARQNAVAAAVSGDPDVVVVLDGARRLRSLPGVSHSCGTARRSASTASASTPTSARCRRSATPWSSAGDGAAGDLRHDGAADRRGASAPTT